MSEKKIKDMVVANEGNVSQVQVEMNGKIMKVWSYFKFKVRWFSKEIGPLEDVEFRVDDD